jgi:hypothetical protein
MLPQFRGPAAQHPRPRACPVAAAEDALLLFCTGRVAMAGVVVATLPVLILEAENGRLKARIAELEAMLAERRDLLGRLDALAPDTAELEVPTP